MHIHKFGMMKIYAEHQCIKHLRPSYEAFKWPATPVADFPGTKWVPQPQSYHPVRGPKKDRQTNVLTLVEAMQTTSLGSNHHQNPYYPYYPCWFKQKKHAWKSCKLIDIWYLQILYPTMASKIGQTWLGLLPRCPDNRMQVTNLANMMTIKFVLSPQIFKIPAFPMAFREEMPPFVTTGWFMNSGFFSR